MKTRYSFVDETRLREFDEVFLKAGEIIRKGGLVAFPTETVYGLGANALDKAAVKKIYVAKGRPSDNPLIVHISSLPELYGVAEDVSPLALKLIDAFLPGPLTMIFKKKPIVPRETSGGLDTVAVRFPENVVARRFIRACGVPVAAPSANTSGRPSPTSAGHVLKDLNGKIDMIIDGGSSRLGLESTIVDLSRETPTLLRPGSITVDMLKNVIGELKIDETILKKPSQDLRPLAPGMKYKHYSPLCDITIIKGDTNAAESKIKELTAEALNQGKKCGIIASDSDMGLFEGCGAAVLELGSKGQPETAAAGLFAVLRRCDDLGLDCAFIRAFPEEGVGLAVMNRLKKAAGYKIIDAE
ncbi:MAG: threonylcarbamoyl-AMP synthase [Clostridiales bacterium]|nr:threonylcarbamoyl-AMP synthase [Clostridiales bacterium]